jgi:hypothetical protein
LGRDLQNIRDELNAVRARLESGADVKVAFAAALPATTPFAIPTFIGDVFPDLKDPVTPSVF